MNYLKIVAFLIRKLFVSPIKLASVIMENLAVIHRDMMKFITVTLAIYTSMFILFIYNSPSIRYSKIRVVSTFGIVLVGYLIVFYLYVILQKNNFNLKKIYNDYGTFTEGVVDLEEDISKTEDVKEETLELNMESDKVEDILVTVDEDILNGDTIVDLIDEPSLYEAPIIEEPIEVKLPKHNEVSDSTIVSDDSVISESRKVPTTTDIPDIPTTFIDADDDSIVVTDEEIMNGFSEVSDKAKSSDEIINSYANEFARKNTRRSNMRRNNRANIQSNLD